jgi:transcriptional regulator with XRE-family HTH domain
LLIRRLPKARIYSKPADKEKDCFYNNVYMTVHEIAELAGVSIGTVDRVLHKRGRVSAATKARVEAVIEKYQFTPIQLFLLTA